ncbi:hypothetical protein BDF19DRAFT_410725 [Syncephalis fuscata]|nr:hypothetical protein BDF19DRAFT_410725 [Syncephalis fuscata]
MKRQSFEATSTKTASGSPNSEGVDVEATKPTQIATTTTNSVPAIVMPVVPDAPITPAAATTTTSETSSAGEQVTEVQLAGITLLLVRKGSQITYRLPQHQPIASLSSAQRTTLLNAIRRIHPNRIPSTTATTQQQQQTTKGTKTTATSAVKSAIKPLNRSKARQERPLNPKLTSSHDTAIRSPTLASHSRSLSTPLLPSPTRLVAIAPRPTLAMHIHCQHQHRHHSL